MAEQSTVHSELNDLPVRLASVGLKKAYFELKKEEQQEVEANVGMQLKVEITTECSDRFDFMVTMSAKLVGREQETEEEIFLAECKMAGGFEVDQDATFDQSSLKAHSSEFVALLYPLLREYISDSVTKMGLRSFYMPWSVSPPSEVNPNE